MPKRRRRLRRWRWRGFDRHFGVFGGFIWEIISIGDGIAPYPPDANGDGVTEAERINSSARILDLYIYFYFIYRWLGVLKNAFSRSTYYQEMSMLKFYFIYLFLFF